MRHVATAAIVLGLLLGVAALIPADAYHALGGWLRDGVLWEWHHEDTWQRAGWRSLAEGLLTIADWLDP